MKYYREILLKDGRPCILRNGTGSDATEIYRSFNLTHGETEFLLSYPDENSFDIPQEERFLTEKEQGEREIELCAVLEGRIVGTAGIEAVGTKDKVTHRASFGISIEKAFWGLGIGLALTQACIECARAAGYSQLELDVVGTNERAISLYKGIGFVEYGRNPRGFRTRGGVWQTLILMRLELS